MPLNASLDAALKGAAPLECLLVRVALPGHTIMVVDGAAQLVFGSDTYNGSDPVYGVLDQVETITEQTGTEAPRIRFGFLPASLPALASITAPANQGSEVHVWFGAVHPETGALIGDSELLFFGALDAAEMDADGTRTLVTFDVASAWERFFEPSEGQRLNDPFIQTVWPGARGAEFVPLIQRDLPWGYDAPRPGVVSNINTGRPGGVGDTGGMPQ